MAAKAFKSKLNAAKKMWGGARERAKSEPGFNELPDGRYDVQIIGAEIGKSESSGRLQIVFEYKVLKGKHKGETIREYLGMETEDNMVWVFRRLAKLGYDIDGLEFDQLEDILSDTVESKTTMIIRLVTKGEYQNVKLVRVNGDSETGATDEESEDDAEDDDDSDDSDDSDDDDSDGDDEDADDDDDSDSDDSDDDEDGDDSDDSDGDDGDDSDDEDGDDDDGEESEEVELNVGDTVEFKVGKKTMTGEVVKLMADGIKVKSDDGKTRTIPDGEYEPVAPFEGDDDEDDVPEEPAPKKGAKKRTPEPEPAKPGKAAKKSAPAPEPPKKTGKKTPPAPEPVKKKKSAPAPEPPKKTGKKSVSRR